LEEEQDMTKTLESQLHFVRAIQNVDTTGVKPLQSIRDETEAGVKESTVSLASLKLELDKEEVVGHSRRIRRRRDAPAPLPEERDWDPVALASKKIGRYIVVETGKG
jgi:Asp-tRNA(Asn)/Glu-tRNA(Gln) amidotransferase C subunit